MLSTGFPQFWFWTAMFFGGLFVGLLIFTVQHARKLGNYCASCVDWVNNNNIEALSESKLGELERSLTELWDSHSSLLASHKRLRSKYGMRDLRERKKNGEDEEPTEDLFSDDDKKAAYKAKLRNECRAKGLLR
jgi:hypothetical protein